MAAPDMDVIKEIPGYKVIMKAILKSQIQQLVEQLATHTDEESIILTASVSDGTLSHLGSDSGKNFLDDHEDVKSQFLGFCLKHHHRKKQAEKERQLLEQQRQQQQQMMPLASRYGPGPRPGFMPSRSPRQMSPRFSSPRMVMHSPRARHEPYPVSRPLKRPSLNFNQGVRAPGVNQSMRLPIGNRSDGQVIKIEADETDDLETDQSVSDTAQQGSGANVASSSQPSSPSHTPTTDTARVKSESSDKDDDARSESSSSTIPNEASDLKSSDIAPPEGLSLDSDLSNLISGERLSAPQTPTSAPPTPSSVDPNISVKVEAITESEMELEITGVEPGRAQMGQSPQDWVQNMPGGMGYDPMGATGNPEDMQGYRMRPQSIPLPMSSATASMIHSEALAASFMQSDPLTASMQALDQFNHFPVGGPIPVGGDQDTSNSVRLQRCEVCGKVFPGTWQLKRHFMIHTGEKPYSCDLCDRRFNQKGSLKAHFLTHYKEKDNQ